jgi:hypothetical protein
MFHVTLTGFSGFAPGPPQAHILVEDHCAELAETLEWAKVTTVPIAAGLVLEMVPHHSYTHTYTSPLLGVEYVVSEHLF